MLKQLIGHVSPETAYVVADYPYGFRLRCSIRYWIETKAGFGQRFVSQTTNPKKPGEVWNKPKAGIYSPVLVMYLDEQDHVHHAGISVYESADVISAFARGWELDTHQQAVVKAMLAAHVLYTARKGIYREGLAYYAGREA